MTWEIFNTRQKSMRKIRGKENGGSFGLDRKSLGSDTDTKT